MKFRWESGTFGTKKCMQRKTKFLCLKVDCLQVEVTMQDCMKGNWSSLASGEC